MRILILGPQGSGKGTQAKRIAAAYDAPHVATGDILRAAVSDGSELGRQVRPIVERGDLVPDELMVGLIRERIVDEDAFVLDGFPRTVAQATALDELLVDHGRSLGCAVLLEVPTDDLLSRLSSRGRSSERSDDSPEVIGKRLAVYEEQTKPVVEHYEKAGLLRRVNGVGDVDQIRQRVEQAIA